MLIDEKKVLHVYFINEDASKTDYYWRIIFQKKLVNKRDLLTVILNIIILKSFYCTNNEVAMMQYAMRQ